MRQPVQYDEDKRYYRWLILCWFIWPVITCAFTLLVGVINETDSATSSLLHNFADRNRLYGILTILDLVYLAHIVTEFYTVSFSSSWLSLLSCSYLIAMLLSLSPSRFFMFHSQLLNLFIDGHIEFLFYLVAIRYSKYFSLSLSLTLYLPLNNNHYKFHIMQYLYKYLPTSVLYCCYQISIFSIPFLKRLQ